MEDSDPGGGGHWDAEPTSDPTPSVGRSWAVVRLVQCITGPRLKRAYFQSRSIEVRSLLKLLYIVLSLAWLCKWDDHKIFSVGKSLFSK